MQALIKQLAPYIIRHIDITDTPDEQIQWALCTLEHHIITLGVPEAINAGHLPKSFGALTVNQACTLVGRCAEVYHPTN
jgi:hypothetical protein